MTYRTGQLGTFSSVPVTGTGVDGSEHPDNVGAMRSANKETTSNVLNKGMGESVSERHDNARAEQIKPMTDTNKNKTAATNKEQEAKTETKRTKANYDTVCGTLFGHVKENLGTTLNDLCDIFGTVKSDKKTSNPDGKWAFPVIYAGVQKLKKAGTLFATGAKKNQGLYLTAEDAKKHTPEPTVRVARKKDSPFVLEKQTAKGTWRASEGGTEEGPITEAFKVASSVPGSVYRVVDNTGKEPKVLMTNEEPPKAATKKVTKKVTKTKEPTKASK